jgi:bacillithiol system protein YtxJ
MKLEMMHVRGRTTMKTIETEQQLQEVLNEHRQDTVILFKHSTQCPVSAAAYQQVQKFERESDVPVYLVRVIEERPVSNAVAEQFGIKHESPQAIVLRGGAVKWHASHWDVTRDALQRATQDA